MRMKRNLLNSKTLRLLLLLLWLLPAGVWAQDKSQAMLYVEKTNGEVVPVPITEGYPQLSLGWDYSGPEVKPGLQITRSKRSGDYITIRSSEIRRLYTGFEATGIREIRSGIDTLSEGVYTLNGTYVGSDSRALDNQPKGVYIIKKNGKYQKVVRP